eukprot:350905-Chlamydomonas_euryale.AAC.9
MRRRCVGFLRGAATWHSARQWHGQRLCRWADGIATNLRARCAVQELRIIEIATAMMAWRRTDASSEGRGLRTTTS